MSIDLDELPEKIALPSEPHKKRWGVLMLFCVAVGAGLTVFFWPQERLIQPVWFWCCAVVFPLMAGGLLYGLRYWSYENQRDYVVSWNQTHDERRAQLIEQGQRAVALIARSYCTPVGHSQLANALVEGKKPLQARYVESRLATLTLSELSPEVTQETDEEYQGRLAQFLNGVMTALDEELTLYSRTTPLHVRIQHDGVLSDETVLSLWRASCMTERPVADVRFVHQEEGLMWLDTWLDNGTPHLLLSIEIHLYQRLQEGEVESVSALLFAQPMWCERWKIVPYSFISRPVQSKDVHKMVGDALLWGKLADVSSPCFVWHSQLPRVLFTTLTSTLTAIGRAITEAKSHDLDTSLGRPATAVGQIMLICASEHAASTNEAQLVVFYDKNVQCCVIRPNVI